MTNNLFTCTIFICMWTDFSIYTCTTYTVGFAYSSDTRYYRQLKITYTCSLFFLVHVHACIHVHVLCVCGLLLHVYMYVALAKMKLTNYYKKMEIHVVHNKYDSECFKNLFHNKIVLQSLNLWSVKYLYLFWLLSALYFLPIPIPWV